VERLAIANLHPGATGHAGHFAMVALRAVHE
jgi:hypothetical protein